MICRMRPRRPWVSDEAPITATERGHSSFPISGTDWSLRNGAGARSTQAEAAGNDAAQDLRGAALDGELGSDRGGKGKLVLQARAVGHLGLEEHGQLAHPARQLAFPHCPQVLDDRALDH